MRRCRSEILLALAGFCFLPQIAFAQEGLPWEIKEKDGRYIVMLVPFSEDRYEFYVPKTSKASEDEEIKLRVFKKEKEDFNGSLFFDRKVEKYLTFSLSDEERTHILGTEGEKSVILFVKGLGKDVSVYPELNFEVSFVEKSYATRITLTEIDSFSFPKQKR